MAYFFGSLGAMFPLFCLFMLRMPMYLCVAMHICFALVLAFSSFTSGWSGVSYVLAEALLQVPVPCLPLSPPLCE